MPRCNDILVDGEFTQLCHITLGKDSFSVGWLDGEVLGDAVEKNAFGSTDCNVVTSCAHDFGDICIKQSNLLDLFNRTLLYCS